MKGRLVEFSLPVVWLEGRGALVAGRLDVTATGLHLDGGSRDARRIRDVPFADIASFRIGRDNGDRIGGRRAVILQLAAGDTVSMAAFERPGAEAELLERLEAADIGD
jgi:hypothetical protein